MGYVPSTTSTRSPPRSLDRHVRGADALQAAPGDADEQVGRGLQVDVALGDTVGDGLARAERKREHAQRVTAPSAALETSLAYLASTPVPDSPLSGAS